MFFLKVDKTCVDILGILPGFMESENLGDNWTKVGRYPVRFSS